LLTVIPALSIFGLREKYTATEMTGVLPGIIFVIFCVMAFILSDYTFREDSQHGMYKNDMTNGVSRTGIYLAKLLCGLILVAFLWTLCSGVCIASVTYSFSWNEGLALLQKMISAQGITMFLQTVFYLAIFQALSVVIRKTSALILTYAVLSAALSNAGDLLRSVFPRATVFLDRFDLNTITGTAPFTDFIPLLLLPVLCGAAVTVFGNILFARKEF
jgi:ABC-type transport system involved in multi-copper enzyme maturation permease subunit